MSNAMEWLDEDSDFSSEDSTTNWDKLRGESVLVASDGNWQEYVEQDSADTFWYNTKSGEYTYIRPENFDPTGEMSAKRSRQVPPPPPQKTTRAAGYTKVQADAQRNEDIESEKTDNQKKLPPKRIDTNMPGAPPPPKGASPPRIRPRIKAPPAPKPASEEALDINQGSKFKSHEQDSAHEKRSEKIENPRTTEPKNRTDDEQLKSPVLENEESLDGEVYSDFSEASEEYEYNDSEDKIDEQPQAVRQVDRRVPVKENDSVLDTIPIEAEESQSEDEEEYDDADLLHHSSAGGFRFFSGILAEHDVTWQGGTYYEEAYVILRLLQRCVEANGLKLSDVVKIDMNISQIEELPQVDEAFFQFFPQAPFPARTIIGNCTQQGGGNVQVSCILKDPQTAVVVGSANPVIPLGHTAPVVSATSTTPAPAAPGSTDFFRKIAKKLPVAMGGVGKLGTSFREKEITRRWATLWLRLAGTLLGVIVASLLGSANCILSTTSVQFAMATAILFVLYSTFAAVAGAAWVLENVLPHHRPQQPKISQLISKLSRDELGTLVTVLLAMDLMFVLLHVSAASSAAAIGALAGGTGLCAQVQAAAGLHFVMLLLSVWVTALQVKWYLLRFPNSGRGQAVTYPATKAELKLEVKEDVSDHSVSHGEEEEEAYRETEATVIV